MCLCVFVAHVLCLIVCMCGHGMCVYGVHVCACMCVWCVCDMHGVCV